MQLARQFSSPNSSSYVNRDVTYPALGVALAYAVSIIVMTCLSGSGRFKPPRQKGKQVWALVAYKGNQLHREAKSPSPLTRVHG